MAHLPPFHWQTCHLWFQLLHFQCQLLRIPQLNILLLFYCLFSPLTVGSLMNTKTPTTRVFLHARHVRCTVSVSRLMSKRNLRTGVLIFRIYLSIGRIIVPKAFCFLAMLRILLFVHCLPWSPLLQLLLHLHLIWLQVSSVQSTSIRIALPLFFKLLRCHIQIGEYGFKVITKRRGVLSAWAPSNALLWVNIAFYKRRAHQRLSQRWAFWLSRKTNNSCPFELNPWSLSWAIMSIVIGPRAIYLPRFFISTVSVFWSAWRSNIVVVSNRGIAKMPSVRGFSLRKKSRLFAYLPVTWTLLRMNIGYFSRPCMTCGVVRATGMRRLTPFYVPLVL